MIKNAKDTSLFANSGTLPNMRSALSTWFQRVYFTKVNKSVTNFSNVESPISYSFYGVKQPFSAQQLEMKPEGQRQWKWYTIHAYPDLVLQPDDVINILDVNYRVKDKTDYTEYSYVEYHVVEDYAP